MTHPDRSSHGRGRPRAAGARPPRWRTLAAAALLAGISAAPGHAEETGCAAFKWPLARELALLSGPLPQGPSETGPRTLATGYATVLRPADQATFTAPPGRPPRPGSYGGTIRFEAPKAAGPVLVSLSAEAWIDLVQGGASRPSVDFSGRRDCPGLRKSVRFMVEAAPFGVQVSGAAEPELRLAVTPAE